jgi:hypothetical protein
MGVRFCRLQRRLLGHGADSRELAVTTVDGRRFRVTDHGDYGHTLVAHMRPYPTVSERARRLVGGVDVYEIAHMRFKVETYPERRRGFVANIGVDDAHRHQGWASSMVAALLVLYPDCVWTVESPNEQSGQLFVHLAARHPGRIVPAVEDTSFPVDDPRRYRMPEQW